MPAPRSDSVPPRASPLARQAALAYGALLVYASLYPLAGWNDPGIGPFAYLEAPWPRWLTGFDIVTNVLAYMPLGALLVLAARPRLARIAAVLAATVCAVALSGALEALQTFLPNRIASNVDLGLNTAGALLGALLMTPFAAAIVDRGPLRALRSRWFADDASAGLMLVAAWLVAQLAPQPMLFGLGEIATASSEWIAMWTGTPPEPMVWIDFPPDALVATEAFVSGTALAGIGLLVLEFARPTAPRFLLVAGIVLAAIVARSFASAIVLDPADTFDWVTPGGSLGLAIGLIVALAAAYAPWAVRRAFAIFLIAASAVVVNVAPADPYFIATMAERTQGRWINFNGLLHALAAAWPWVALAWLVVRRRRARPI